MDGAPEAAEGGEVELSRESYALPDQAEDVTRLVRMLSASVNVRVLSVLVDARRRDDASDGWRFLSGIAKELDEAPGTVSLAIQRLVPDLVEEKREKGRRYFRARVTGVTLSLDTPET